MANSFFEFKQFRVNQSLAAMKVGTDGVLLGAWCRIAESQHHILDIGAGTGIIALMAAQRSDNFQVKPVIDALEIDSGGFDQASENFKDSKWADRLNIINISLQEFRSTISYDHIISNPPYFNNSLQSPDSSRTAARHTSELNYKELADGVERLLSDNGICSLIIPYSDSVQIVDIFYNAGLKLSRQTDVMPRADKQPKRSLLEFSRTDSVTEQTSLIIEQSVRHDYTPDYKALTKDFYLKF